MPYKKPSIGPFIKDYFLKQKKTVYPYELWNSYDKIRKENHKSIKYNSFLKYIYMLEQIGLLRKTDIYVPQLKKKIISGAKTQDKLLFVWEYVPGKDNPKVISYLKERYIFDWINKAEIIKSPDKRLIRLKIEDDYIDFIINPEQTEVSIFKQNEKLETLKAEKTKKNISVFQKTRTTSDMVKRSESKSKTAPAEWYRQYYTINKKPKDMPSELWDDMWYKPQKYYREMLYKQEKYGTLKGKKTKEEYEKVMKKIRKEREARVPSTKNTAIIKISKQLKEYIDKNKSETDTYNSYITKRLMV